MRTGAVAIFRPQREIGIELCAVNSPGTEMFVELASVVGHLCTNIRYDNRRKPVWGIKVPVLRDRT